MIICHISSSARSSMNVQWALIHFPFCSCSCPLSLSSLCQNSLSPRRAWSRSEFISLSLQFSLVPPTHLTCLPHSISLLAFISSCLFRSFLYGGFLPRAGTLSLVSSRLTNLLVLCRKVACDFKNIVMF